MSILQYSLASNMLRLPALGEKRAGQYSQLQEDENVSSQPRGVSLVSYPGIGRYPA